MMLKLDWMNEIVLGLLVLAVTIFLLGLVVFIMARSQKLARVANMKWPERLTKQDLQDSV
jgi:hypothetical protein